MACPEPMKSGQDSYSGEYWQSELQDPVERLTVLYDESRLTDLTISFPGYEDTIKVHRLILAMSSPVFEHMFYGPLAVGDQLVLPEDPPEAFRWLVIYIYRGSKCLCDISIAIQVYHLANKYQMKDLASICSKFLQSQLDVSNLFLIYDTASMFDDYNLQDKCIEVVNNYTGKLLSSVDIQHLNRWSMQHLLQQELNVQSEVVVYQCLLKWGTYQGSKASPSHGDHSLRQEIEKLLPLIRFLTMTQEEFEEHVVPSKVLTSDESSAILMNIKKMGNIPLPEICSQNRRRREVKIMAMCHQVPLRYHEQVFNTQAKYDSDEEDYRIELDKRFVRETVGLSNRDLETFCQLLGDSTEKFSLISGMAVTMDILLGGIMCSVEHPDIESTKILISDSAGRVLKELQPTIKKNFIHKNLRRCRKSRIKATLDVPLLLSKDETYRIYLRDYQFFNVDSDFSVVYGRNTVTGRFSKQIDPVIYFWCSDVF